MDFDGVDSNRLDDQIMPGLVVSLSGGGYRATAFSLGALMFLVDSELNKHVASIASVSGGTIANAALAVNDKDFRHLKPGEMDDLAARVVKEMRSRPLIAVRCPFAVYLLVSLGMVVFGVACLVFGWSSKGLSLGIAITGAWLFLLRGAFVENRVNSLMKRVSATKHSLSLSEIDDAPPAQSRRDDGVEHVFCATNLNDGGPFFFSTWDGGRCYTRPLEGANEMLDGWMYPDRLSLGAAIRASMAFPGVIPPKRLSVSRSRFNIRSNRENVIRLRERLELRGGQRADYGLERLPAMVADADAGTLSLFPGTDLEYWRSLRKADGATFKMPWRQSRTRPDLVRVSDGSERKRRFRFLLLGDGGLWNNLGNDWFVEGSAPDPDPSQHVSAKARGNRRWLNQPKLLVINATSPYIPKQRWVAHVPFLADIALLYWSLTILYSSSVSSRTRSLKFARRAGYVERKTAFPLAVEMTEHWPNATDAIQAERRMFECGRENRFNSRHESDRKEWKELAELCAGVKTTLGRLSVEQYTNLLFHGYRMAAATCYVDGIGLYGEPLLPDRVPDLPDRTRFERVAGV